MEWSEVQEKDKIFLNLGGAEFYHLKPGYEGYVSVDLDPPASGWSVKHDLAEPIPLPDGKVSRIHSEDFLEHITVDQIKAILSERHRLFEPGGTMRIGVPDYNNPKDRPYLEAGSDPKFPLHAALIHYRLMKKIVEDSPFAHFEFYHYWDGNTFVSRPIGYSRGKSGGPRPPPQVPPERIRATPENFGP